MPDQERNERPQEHYHEDGEVFRNGREAQAIVENWRQEYNNYRPHSSLGYLTPVEFARRYYEKNQVKEVRQPVEKAGSLSL